MCFPNKEHFALPKYLKTLANPFSLLRKSNNINFYREELTKMFNLKIVDSNFLKTNAFFEKATLHPESQGLNLQVSDL